MPREIPLNELLLGLDGVRVVSGDTAGVMVRGITEDSRLVQKDWLFIARRGERFDGRLFIDEAFTRGASAVMIDRDEEIREDENMRKSDRPGGEGIRIFMNDAAETIGKVAERFYDYPTNKITLIGITGTNGKTTTAHLMYDMLNRAGRKCGLIGTVSVDDGRGMKPAELTTPFAIDLSRTLEAMVEHGCTHAVMEVSSHALEQKRVCGLRFTGGIFTNLTGDHLDYHGTMEKYADAKALLFASLNNEAQSWAVINNDDEAGERMAEACGRFVKLVRVHQGYHGVSAHWSVSIENISSNGMTLLIRCGNDEKRVRTELVGEHNAMNLLEACAAVVECGVSFTEACRLMEFCHAPPGRLEGVTTRRDVDGLMVLVDYAHTDDALANVLIAVRPLAQARDGRLIVVFGCGGDRDKSKRPRMMKAACAGADVVMVTSDNPRTEDPDAIVNDILAGVDEDKRKQMEQVGRLNVETARRTAVQRVITDIARDNDIVVIAGKGHEDYQITGRTKHALDDRVIARYALLIRSLHDSDGLNNTNDNDIAGAFWSHDGFRIATGGYLRNMRGGNGPTEQGRGNDTITGISIDSRTIREGEAFIAVRGERFDGHDYIEKAFAQGAQLAVVNGSWWERNGNAVNEYDDNTVSTEDNPAAFLVVKDTTAALGDLASVWREVLLNSNTTVVAITGSCGKTTTKDMLNTVLSERQRGSAGIKSYNNDIGVPLTILAAEVDDEYLIVEIGSNAPGEIHTLGSIARPDIAIITNIGRSHLAGLGSVAGVAREKAALLSTLASENGWAVCPADNRELQSVSPRNIRTVWFGESTGADLRLVDEVIINNDNELTTQFTLNDGSTWRLPVVGRHFVLDTLAVIATARGLGMNDADIQSGLLKMKLPAMRMEIIHVDNGPRIYNDAYNANPESMPASIHAFISMTNRTKKNRRILVLGEMLELGNASIPCHREIMLKVVRMAQRRLVDRICFVGSAFREASKAGIRFGSPTPTSPVIEWIESINDEETLARLAAIFQPGDAILLKGSRRVGLERVLAYCQQAVNEKQ